MAEQNYSPGNSAPGQIIDQMSRLFRPEILDIGSPALVQHLAYRVHDDYADRPDEWPGSIQKLVGSLDKWLSRKTKDTPACITAYNERPGAIDAGEDRRFRTARFGFKWHGIPARIDVKATVRIMELARSAAKMRRGMESGMR